MSNFCVRHPLSRLVSVYHQKLIDLGLTSWKSATDIMTFRRKKGMTRVDVRSECGGEYVGDNDTYARSV